MLARSGDQRATPRTQVALAVTQDDERWLLVGASPDLRQQLLSHEAMAPRHKRHSPIACVVLLSADVDGMAGLLVLREQQPFRIYAPASILNILRDNPIFRSLDPSLVRQIPIAPGEPVTTDIGLTLTLLEMPGKIPLYQENRASALAEPSPTYAAKLQAGGKCVIIAPGCAQITEQVQAGLREADLLFFDGTLFTDDEMITAGLSHKTGRRMGHVPISGDGGSMFALSAHPGRRIYLHINNTNPILLAGSEQHEAVRNAGFEVAFDGMVAEV